ncbi:hypothetical protein PV721_21415 [Streptomyces sp. MB09-01]|uniref:hypothetical protein n=1 Tax=Streptomyces sp. MB09-01 TaxID=3028666 RepID=UPI0029A79F8A|nr:hypothetical protein [Streptomyces sp. MB09-01]MDX3536886.1 hypothetical protein [Streptomyces sp. MB09-01]
MPARLSARAHGQPVVAPRAATAEVLRILGAGRICRVDPPWFDAVLNGPGRAHYEGAGFAVVRAAPCGLPGDQSGIRPEALLDRVVSFAPDEAEAVGGNGFRAVGVIEALEAALGRPHREPGPAVGRPARGGRRHRRDHRIQAVLRQPGAGRGLAGSPRIR